MLVPNWNYFQSLCFMLCLWIELYTKYMLVEWEIVAENLLKKRDSAKSEIASKDVSQMQGISSQKLLSKRVIQLNESSK